MILVVIYVSIRVACTSRIIINSEANINFDIICTINNFAVSPTISSFYISQAPEYSLICISNNSAATVVTWKRNGVPITIDGIVFDSSQTVIDTQHSIYENKLVFLTFAVPPGLYTCMVTNDFGSTTSDHGINSKHIILLMMIILCYYMTLYTMSS